jgi:hypothetical protein
MAFTKGKSGNPNGRPKGLKDKRTRTVEEIAAKFDMDPLEILLRFAHRDWKGLGYKSQKIMKTLKDGSTVLVDVISPELQQASAMDAARFIHPQKKAVDVKLSEDSAPIVVHYVEAPCSK